MAYITFDNIGITALAAAVPRTVIDNYEYTQYFDAVQVRQIVDKTGVRQRRFADSETCASDLCYAAAERLIADNNINRDEIDLLVFISQTPDYRMPATSIILQQRLGLSKNTIAFDISLGCSGFLYALSVVYSMMSTGCLRKALVLDGETRSKVYSPKDRRTAFLFGDGGAAVLVEKSDVFGKSYFSLHSDGTKEDLIKIDGGGYRHQSSADTLTERVVDEYGNIRSDEQGYMKGADVFNFVIVEIPRDIRGLFEYAGVSIDAPDYYVFHQANDFINGYLRKKLKLDAGRIPSTIEKYGNTSSVSIPLTIADQLKGQMQGDKLLLLNAFGVGMSWASALMRFHDLRISDIVEV